MTTSQIRRATFDPIGSPCSSTGRGMTWNVEGSGIATMSDSSIALKPVIDEPSKPIPSFSASCISAGVIANDFRWPSRSVNQKRTCSMPSSLIRFSTARRAATLEVARSRLFTIVARVLVVVFALGLAIESLLENGKSPGRRTARGLVASHRPRESTSATRRRRCSACRPKRQNQRVTAKRTRREDEPRARASATRAARSRPPPAP